MSVAVEIRVEDESSNPIDGVTVEVYDASTLASVGSAVTGSHAPGEVEITVTGSAEGKAFYARATKLATSPLAPVLEYVDRKAMVVFEPAVVGSPNRFILEQPPAPYAATDAALCRCVLKALRFNKTPIEGLIVTIRQAGGRPTLTYEGGTNTVQAGVLAWSPMRMRTDENGIAYVDLPRGGVFRLDIPNWIPQPLDFGVPDQAGADLMDLAAPYVKSITPSASVVGVGVGAEVDVTLSSLLISNGLTADPITGVSYNPLDFLDVSIDNANCSVVWKGTDTLTITGAAVGTSIITLSRKEWTNEGRHQRVPEPPLSGNTITVNVS